MYKITIFSHFSFSNKILTLIAIRTAFSIISNGSEANGFDFSAAWDGRYGRSRRRIEKFGNYILPNEIDMADNKFYPESRRGWIRNEYMWFWFYLSEGQVMAHTGPSTIPEAIKTKPRASAP